MFNKKNNSTKHHRKKCNVMHADDIVELSDRECELVNAGVTYKQNYWDNSFAEYVIDEKIKITVAGNKAIDCEMILMNYSGAVTCDSLRKALENAGLIVYDAYEGYSQTT